MRILVRCSGCKRQFDASSMKAGSCFRCNCGQVVCVPVAKARDAEVVRCSSCGAARPGGALSCPYCRSDFTLHERDLETICPSCCARISDRARFCHHCGTPIVPEEAGFAATSNACPACGPAHPLHSRALGTTPLTCLECGRCAGLWLANETFRILSERARDSLTPADPAQLRRDVHAPEATHAAQGPAYRPCAVCSKRMNRANFGRRSGVLIDRCREHGIWFDARELDAVLRWIEEGGEVLAEESRREEERMANSAARFRVEVKVPEDAWRHDTDSGWGHSGLLPLLARLLKKG